MALAPIRLARHALSSSGGAGRHLDELWNGWRNTEGKEGHGGIGLAASLGYDVCNGGQWCGGPVLRVLATYALTNPGCSVALSSGAESGDTERPRAYVVSVSLGASFRFHGWR